VRFTLNVKTKKVDAQGHEGLVDLTGLIKYSSGRSREV